MKRMLLGLGSVVGLALIFLAYANVAVGRASQDHAFHDAEEIPHHRVAIVLGTTPLIKGRKNKYFEGRMDAAAKLYVSGRADLILVSGDGTPGAIETTSMRDSLIKRGVPSGVIKLDNQGLRTLDTVVRARKVFGLTDCTFVTDDFHMPRTLYLAQHNGIEADGYLSKSLPVAVSPTTHIREAFARALVVLDCAFGRGPKYLGSPIKI